MNSLIIAFRTLKKHKLSSAISIFSLALGIATLLLLFNYIDYQLSYDKFINKDVKRVIAKHLKHDFKTEYRGWRSIKAFNAAMIIDSIPSIESISREINHFGNNFIVNNEPVVENLKYVDPNYFDYFSLEVIEGTLDLTNPGNIVVDEYFKEKYFKDMSPIGKSIQFNHGDRIYTKEIVGVVKDIPRNSHLYRKRNHLYMSVGFFQSIQNEYFESLDGDFYIGVYFIPKKGYNAEVLEEEFEFFSEKLVQDENFKDTVYSYEDARDIYLRSKEMEINPDNPMVLVLLLSTVTLSIFIISIINSVSILTGQSISRTKEVGIRLLAGASKRELAINFLFETLLVSTFATILALVIYEIALPTFSNMVNIELKLRYNLKFIVVLFFSGSISGVLAGLYPALILSNLPIVDSLKGQRCFRSSRVRKVIVIVQFIFASIILTWSLVINSEIKILKNIDPGFNYKDLLYIETGIFGASVESKRAFKNELLGIDGVDRVSLSAVMPWNYGSWASSTSYNEDGSIAYDQRYTWVDIDYFETLGLEVKGNIELLMGDTLLTESNLHTRELDLGSLVNDYNREYRVNGVIKDYYMFSPVNNRDTVHYISEERTGFTIIRFRNGEVVEEIREVWRKFFPEKAFSIRFVKDIVEREYETKEIGLILGAITFSGIISIIITFMGLLGLIIFSVEAKAKEIAVRKIVGASWGDIVISYLKKFQILILIALIVGLPLGIITIEELLLAIQYPFRISNKILISIISGTLCLGFGSILAVVLSYRSARSNPGNSLRYE